MLKKAMKSNFKCNQVRSTYTMVASLLKLKKKRYCTHTFETHNKKSQNIASNNLVTFRLHHHAERRILSYNLYRLVVNKLVRIRHLVFVKPHYCYAATPISTKRMRMSKDCVALRLRWCKEKCVSSVSQSLLNNNCPSLFS